MLNTDMSVAITHMSVSLARTRPMMPETLTLARTRPVICLWPYDEARNTDMCSRLTKGSRLNKADCRGDHRGVVASIDSTTPRVSRIGDCVIVCEHPPPPGNLPLATARLLPVT